MIPRTMDFQEDRAVYSGHLEVEILIDRPVDKVWKQLLDLDSWITTHGIEWVAGARDAVGGIVRISPKGLDDPESLKRMGLPPLPPAHYHYGRIIKLVPERQHLIKAYEAPGGSYGLRVRGFEDYRLVPLGGATQVTFNGYIEYTGEMIAEKPDSMTVETSRQNMTTNLMNLKKLLESH